LPFQPQALERTGTRDQPPISQDFRSFVSDFFRSDSSPHAGRIKSTEKSGGPTKDAARQRD
jgi:hypothetical protein